MTFPKSIFKLLGLNHWNPTAALGGSIIQQQEDAMGCLLWACI